ncbi:hypothetical protein Agabi119p4_2202 [Agaricus bisporus var. burnettii]|uniref:J domain-containing protein n=1 Tax=Agaricus bisporus var. burnettii TaxID=192524 RepID=A0A8H7F8L8_AGABI|nr:hypothetical protein Agabi119p4_2202 [Agaricus bisporus var. burnettii]
MVSGSALFSLVGWSIVPDFATRQLLTFIHKTLANRLPRYSPPSQGTPAYRQHYAYTFAFVVLGYLLYNMIQSARALPPNFYEILGVASHVDENGLKAAFRQFAKWNHPDRPGVGEEGARMFMVVRESFEALKSPAVRFAYDRFGPDVLTWKTCRTQRDFLYHGILQSSGYHIVTFVVLIFWSTIGKHSPASFWRFLVFSFFLLSELTLVIAPPGHKSLIFGLFSNRVIFQHILFLHQLFLFFSVALSRVAPLFSSGVDDPRLEKAVLEKTRALASVADREVSIILHTDFHSISPSPAPSNGRATVPLMTPLPKEETISLLQSLLPKMQDLVIEHNLKKDSGPLRSAWEQAISRGRRLLFSSDPQNDMQSQVKNFWEAENADITGFSTVDGSAYCVVDGQTEEMNLEPLPSPPRSLSPKHTEKRLSQDVSVD